MLGRTLVKLTVVGAFAALAAVGCGGVTGVDDGVVSTGPGGPTGPTGPTGPVANIGPPAELTIVSGDSQSVLVNQTAGQRLVIRVLDSSGQPVRNQAVAWEATDQGIVTPLSPMTDDEGLASATWQFSSTPGNQSVRVQAGEQLSATFGGTATLTYRTVDAGGFHACAITPAAAVYCWGYNGDGQLGTNSQSNRNVPTPMASNVTFRQLSGGRYHTCGVTLAGIAYCWGANVDGRLGTDNFTPSLVPVQTATPVTFQLVGSGRNHSCGLSMAGLVYCWGFNQEGEVGALIPPADSVTVRVPRPVSGQSFSTMGVGGLHSCALDLGGAAWCWGFNGYGQLGDGTTTWTLNNTEFGGVPVPVQMPGGGGFEAIAAGLYHSCALQSGTAYCWGDNRHGQLGNGSTTNSLVPVAVTAPTAFTSVSAGDTHSCGVTADGTAYCWGDNSFSQFGDGTTASSPIPVPVAAGLTFASYSAGETLSCGVTTDGSVYCAGNNLYGQIGDATNENRPTPVRGAYQP